MIVRKRFLSLLQSFGFTQLSYIKGMLENWIPWIIRLFTMRSVWSDRTENGLISLLIFLLVLSSPAAKTDRDNIPICINVCKSHWDICLAEGKKRRDHKYITPIPRFLATDSNLTYHKGDLAILYCSVKNLGTKTLVWRRVNESYPLTVGKITYTDDKRFEVAHIDDSQDWNLMISNVSTQDTGPYECQVSAVDRDLRKEVFLHIKDEYSYAIPRISVTGAMHVDRGNELKLVCNATGAITPPDTIDWFKDGKKISGENGFVELRKKLSINSRTISSTLTKKKTVMEDKGTYTCRTSDLQVTSVKVIILNTEKNPTKRGNENHVVKEDMVMGQSASASSQASLAFILHCLYITIFTHELVRNSRFIIALRRDWKWS